jgi:hypothetical protein
MTNNYLGGISMKPSNPDSGSRLKAPVAATPILGEDARFIARDRYGQGGTSGFGSYRRLAEFKAETLNGFVARMRIQSVIRYGCGDGAQLASRYIRAMKKTVVNGLT